MPVGTRDWLYPIRQWNIQVVKTKRAATSAAAPIRLSCRYSRQLTTGLAARERRASGHDKLLRNNLLRGVGGFLRAFLRLIYDCVCARLGF